MVSAVAGWDRNASIDGKGIAILERWLNDDPQHRFLPSLNKKDTEPNYDGYITYGRPEGRKVSPIGRINVQVKSTSTSLVNGNARGVFSKYKYECDTEVLFAAKEEISQDPTGLVIVDIRNEKSYWISLSHDYLERLDLKVGQKRKTLYFDDANLMHDHDEFYNRLLFFRQAHDQFRESVVKDRLLVSTDVPQEKIELLQKMAFDLNDRCRQDLYFLKEGTFPDAWAMALRYTERDNRAYLGITPLRKGENNAILVGNLDIREEPSLFHRGLLTHRYEDEPFLTICCDSNRSLSEMLEELLGNWVKEFVKTFMLRPAVMPDALLAEVFFWYADLLAILVPEVESKDKPGTFPADTLAPTECRRLYEAPYYAGWKRWMEVAQYTQVSREGIHCAAPFSENPHDNNLQDSRRWIQEYIEKGAEDYAQDAGFVIELRDEDVPFNFIREAVEEIESRGLTIHRPWKCSFPEEIRRPAKSGFSFFDVPEDRGCSLEDYESNLDKLYTLYANLRESLLTSFFGPVFPFENTAFFKDITAYFGEWSYCEMTDCYSQQGHGAKCVIRPYSEYDPKWTESCEDEVVQNDNFVSKGITYLAPLFTNSIPLYSLLENDVLEIMERLFPNERFSVLRRCYGYRIGKRDSLKSKRFILVRNG